MHHNQLQHYTVTTFNHHQQYYYHNVSHNNHRAPQNQFHIRLLSGCNSLLMCPHWGFTAQFGEYSTAGFAEIIVSNAVVVSHFIRFCSSYYHTSWSLLLYLVQEQIILPTQGLCWWKHDNDYIFLQILKNITNPDFGEALRKRIYDDRTFSDYRHYGNFYSEHDSGTTHISLMAPNGDAVAATTTINL